MPMLSTLIDYNRKLYKAPGRKRHVSGGDFSLEVSSPGLDEPLKKQRQYKKNMWAALCKSPKMTP
jgi:ribosome maturation factor RimP